MKKAMNKKGFTLIEMTLVVAIIAITASAFVISISLDYSKFKENFMLDGGQFEPEAWADVDNCLPRSFEISVPVPTPPVGHVNTHDNGNHNGWNNPNNPHYTGDETPAPTTAATPAPTAAATPAPTAAPDNTQTNYDVNSAEYFAENLAGTSDTSELTWHHDNGRHNGFGNSGHYGYSGTNIGGLEAPVTHYYYWGEPVVETVVTIPSGITCTEYEIVIEYDGEIDRVNSCWNADYEINGNRITLTTSEQNPGEIGIQVYVSGGESEVRSVVAVGYNTNNGNGNGHGNGRH